MTEFDFTITEHRGGLCLLFPWSARADRWIADQRVNCGWSAWGEGVAIECEKMSIVVKVLQDLGFVIEGNRDESNSDKVSTMY